MHAFEHINCSYKKMTSSERWRRLCGLGSCCWGDDLQRKHICKGRTYKSTNNAVMITDYIVMSQRMCIQGNGDDLRKSVLCAPVLFSYTASSQKKAKWMWLIFSGWRYDLIWCCWCCFFTCGQYCVDAKKLSMHIC